jgi:DNA-binding response OmpR family regulator
MNRPRILIVDDDPSLVRLLQYRLEKRDGYRVFSASNGEEALEQSLSTQPDLVLLDWVMPGLSGLEVLKLLKKNKETREQSVIMLTACNLVGELEQAFEVGAEGYLTKPTHLDKVSAKVSEVLKSRTKKENVRLSDWLGNLQLSLLVRSTISGHRIK